MTVLTIEQAVSWAEEAVKRSPHMNAPPWYFTPQGTPVCLVGCILEKLGVKDQVINGGFNKHHISELFAHGIVICDSRTFLFLEALQNGNDRRLPWCMVLECAKSVVAWTGDIPEEHWATASRIVNTLKADGLYLVPTVNSPSLTVADIVSVPSLVPPEVSGLGELSQQEDKELIAV